MWEVNPVEGLNLPLEFMVSHGCRVPPIKPDTDIILFKPIRVRLLDLVGPFKVLRAADVSAAAQLGLLLEQERH